MATILQANGNELVVTPKHDTPWELSQLQDWVGGYIELVNQDSDGIAYANEEGLLEDLPVNTKASRLFGKTLVGDVVYLPNGEWD